MDSDNKLKFSYPEEALKKPGLYEPGNAVMWTDDYISKKLLEIHLDPRLDSASRKPESIRATIDFIRRLCSAEKMSILDLGCGPGLYARELALLGHHITGVDFSENSIDYAKKSAAREGLSIKYIHRNYLDLKFSQEFDLAMIIFNDFGVLLPEERDIFLQIVLKALKPGGTFIFDVLNDRNREEKFTEHQAWKTENGGFWKNIPYMEVSLGFHYPQHHVFLNQYVIVDELENTSIYRFWTHYYNNKMLRNLLQSAGFVDIEIFDDVLPESDIWNGKNVSFCSCRKPH